MQTGGASAVADDMQDPRAPLLGAREDILTRAKSVPKFFVLRFANMVIYHRGNAGCGSLIASGLSQRMGSETCHDAIHRRDVLVYTSSTRFSAIAVLICLQFFVESYTASCIVYLLNGLFVHKAYGRFAMFSFVMGLDFILPSLASMVLAPLFRSMLDKSTIKVSAWTPWQKIGERERKGLLLICGVLVVLLTVVVGLVVYTGDVVETTEEGQMGSNVEDEETSALAPPAGEEHA
ncbi:hypothetical protein CPB85DRAFT_1255331 [Mucidula mucida]|nr:hypothetical protein CPB85DRAFT_1255331 [Mucidula mucida]